MASISGQAKQNVQTALDGATEKGKSSPGLVFAAVDKSGEYLTQQHSGKHGLSNDTPMSQDSVFCIFSCTKMVTGLACMQLVEQGKLELDNSQQLYKLCPEIEGKKEVLIAPGKWEARKGDITLRMLLSHTAGFGYSFFNERLRDYSRPTGFDEFAGDFKDYVQIPLVNQPGSRWEYGTNIDWAGVCVERATGMKLGDYFQKNIFEPLDIRDMGFLPTQQMRENLVSANQLQADGSVQEIDHPSRRAIFFADEPDAKDKIFQSGGAGLFAKPSEYCKIIAALLNDGTSPTTKARIVSSETVDEMFKNQIPQFGQFANQGIPNAKPNQTNPLPVLYPQEGNPDQGWGLTFHITQEAGATGRGKGTGWWAGIMNLFWWCDREKGVGGMIAGQTFPFGDANIMGAWAACEAAVYQGLDPVGGVATLSI